MALSPAERKERDRQYAEHKYARWASLPKISCACGCGTMIPPINKGGKPARYALGHNLPKDGYRIPLGHEAWNKGKPHPAASLAHKGKKLTPEQIRQRDVTRRAKNNGLYCTKKGWKHTPETIQRMTEASRKSAQERDHGTFYGHTHTPETRAKISAKLSGPNALLHGRTHSPETRAKISANLSGHIVSPETRMKISAKMSGPNHPNWNGGCSTLPYGPEFTCKYKRLIRQRDNYICQRCGITQSEAKRALDIHHVDHNKMNNDPTNLLTVCRACNLWFSRHRDESLILIASTL